MAILAIADPTQLSVILVETGYNVKIMDKLLNPGRYGKP